MNKPIIGITTRIISNELNHEEEKVPHSLIKYIAKYHATALIIPYDKDNYWDLVKKCDGFIIPGGSSWHDIDEEIIKYALNNDIPLIGICAGMQAIGNLNNFCGNENSDKTIKINKENHIDHNNGNLEYVHEIFLNDGILKNIIKSDKIMVNSRHNDTIVPEDFFNIEAVSKDNIIEAISIPNKTFIIGLQWHPEDLKDDNSQKIFQKFISKCQK